MTTETPLGIRNNNPGNIRVNPNIRWNGEVPSDGPYCIYATPVAGLRALAKTLWTYQNAHGCRTVGDFVKKWAPENENNTQAYITDVVLRLNNILYTHIASVDGIVKMLNADSIIDINQRPQIDAMMIAIIWHENGCQPYSSAQINAAIKTAGAW